MFLSPETHLIDLPLSVTICNPLQKESISKLGDVTMCTEADLLDVSQIGAKKVCEVEAFLSAHGLRLRQWDERLWTRALEVYGSQEKIALWPIIMHLFSWGSNPGAIRADKMRVSNQLKDAGLHTIGDLLGKHWDENHSSFAKIIGDSWAERLQGWLIGVDVYWR